MQQEIAQSNPSDTEAGAFIDSFHNWKRLKLDFNSCLDYASLVTGSGWGFSGLAW
jgi:hypothetical protein